MACNTLLWDLAGGQGIFLAWLSLAILVRVLDTYGGCLCFLRCTTKSFVFMRSHRYCVITWVSRFSIPFVDISGMSLHLAERLLVPETYWMELERGQSFGTWPILPAF